MKAIEKWRVLYQYRSSFYFNMAGFRIRENSCDFWQPVASRCENLLRMRVCIFFTHWCVMNRVIKQKNMIKSRVGYMVIREARHKPSIIFVWWDVLSISRSGGYAKLSTSEWDSAFSVAYRFYIAVF